MAIPDDKNPKENQVKNPTNEESSQVDNKEEKDTRDDIDEDDERKWFVDRVADGIGEAGRYTKNKIKKANESLSQFFKKGAKTQPTKTEVIAADSGEHVNQQASQSGQQAPQSEVQSNENVVNQPPKDKKSGSEEAQQEVADNKVEVKYDKLLDMLALITETPNVNKEDDHLNNMMVKIGKQEEHNELHNIIVLIRETKYEIDELVEKYSSTKGYHTAGKEIISKTKEIAKLSDKATQIIKNLGLNLKHESKIANVISNFIESFVRFMKYIFEAIKGTLTNSYIRHYERVQVEQALSEMKGNLSTITKLQTQIDNKAQNIEDQPKIEADASEKEENDDSYQPEDRDFKL